MVRRLLLSALLVSLALPAAAAQQATVCHGELWAKVQGWLKPDKTFDDTIAYLRGQKIDYTVFDSRTPTEESASDTQVPVDLSGATDCKPQKQTPQCSIVLSEPSPASKNAPASPTTVEIDEVISIDFDAKGKQTGHGCEVVETGL